MSDAQATRGMGRCRYCSESPSNVDHIGSDSTGATKLIICGAWDHYMLTHKVTLALPRRSRILAINPDTFTGNTLAYRSVRGTDDVNTLRIFFVEKEDGIHVIGEAVDVELFNHVRLLVLKCQATDVPPALPESSGTAVGGDSPSNTFDALLAQLKEPPAKKKNAEWRAMATVVCNQLHTKLVMVSLSDLATDAERRSLFHQLIVAAFQGVGFAPEVILVVGMTTGSYVAAEILAEQTVGHYPKGAVNLIVRTDGKVVSIGYDRVPPSGNLRLRGQDG